MISRAQLIHHWKQVPLPIRTFLARGLFLFLLWKAIYVLYVGPQGQWNETLTRVTGQQTAAFMNVIRNTDRFHSHEQSTTLSQGENEQFGSRYKSALQYDGNTILYIFDSCNGLELLVLYAGFILCYPAHWLKKSLFISFGIPVIFYINVLRCAALAHVRIWRPEFLDFAHHYLFKMIVYLCILVLWWLFSIRDKSSSDNSPAIA